MPIYFILPVCFAQQLFTHYTLSLEGNYNYYCCLLHNAAAATSNTHEKQAQVLGK